MPTPSLLIVPARFKSGKLYSQIPTSGAGDFTVTRATAATRVNASGYIESVASGIPRLDYFASGGTIGCPALLVEPSGSNLLLRSEEFDNVSWSKTGLTASTGTTTEFTSPDGNLTAESLTLSLVSGGHTCNQFSRWPSGTTSTASIFVKADTATKFFIANGSLGVGVFFNLSNGTIEGQIGAISGTITPFGNNYYKLTATHTATGLQTFQLGIYQTFVTNDYLATIQFTPASANRLFVWGAQLETGSVATSYIPTTTGSVTRNADVISVSGAVSGSIGQTQGTIYAEVDLRNFPSPARLFGISDGTSNNRIILLFNTSNRIRLLATVATASQVDINSSSQVAGVFKIAVAYALNDYAFYINGVQVGTDTIALVPACSSIFLGNAETGLAGSNINDRIRAAALYTTRLTNDQLAALTTP